MAAAISVCPRGLDHDIHEAHNSSPETATRSRERRRVALVVRELTSYLDERFNELNNKLDVATAGLVTIANKELSAIPSDIYQPDAEKSPEKQLAPSTRPSHQPVVPLEDACAKTLTFDIYEAADVSHVGVQTCGTWEALGNNKIYCHNAAQTSRDWESLENTVLTIAASTRADTLSQSDKSIVMAAGDEQHCDSSGKTSSSLLSQCEALADKLQSQFSAICIDRRDMLETLVFEHFGPLLEACPNEPKTKLKRDTITEIYRDVHHHWVWYSACRRYHSGTGDPCCKSEEFMQMLRIIEDLCSSCQK